MALPSSVPNDFSFRVWEYIFLEYPEITSPEQGLRNDSENYSMNQKIFKPDANARSEVWSCDVLTTQDVLIFNAQRILYIKIKM